MSLEEAGPAAAIAAIQGVMTVDWEDTCDGYVLNQRLATRLIDNNGEEVVSDLAFASFEGEGLDRFEFTMTHRLNGVVEEEFAGTVTPAEESPGYTISYEEGGPERLPAETIFPTRLTAELVAAALAGSSQLRRTIFDGSDNGRYYFVSAVIGDPVLDLGQNGATEETAAAAEDDPAAHLEGMRSWPVLLSYYRAGSREEVPEYEVRFRLYESGVADEVIMDYGTFAMRGELQRLAVRPNPCR
jgi:hypothetical protein